MKFCPQCNTVFPDRDTVCPTHGIHLSEIIDLKPGMLIRGTYRIVRKLGEGGFGAVYLADQTLMREQRAIKFLSSQLSRDEAFTARFRDEVRSLRQVRHRNVVDCGDLEQAEDGTLFFAMDYVDGPNLHEWLSQCAQPLEVPQVMKITRSIAEGLAAAHARGMVHRDIKPENILLAREQDTYVPKIADFGIVATKESSTTARTIAGHTLLTPAYAAPEQWTGTPAAELDGRTDLYALGGLLFEMLTGKTAFRADSYEGWRVQHLTRAPAPPSSLRADLVRWQGLDALALGLLAKDRNKRPKDVAEVLKLIDAVRGAAPKVVERTVVQERGVRAAAVVESPGKKPGSAATRKSQVPGQSRWLWGVAGAVVFLVAIFAVVKFRSRLPTLPPRAAVSVRNEVRTLNQAAPVLSLAFSPDGLTLASGCWDGAITLWDVGSAKRLRQVGVGRTLGMLPVMFLAFPPDGRILASDDPTGGAILWDLASGEAVRSVDSMDAVRSIMAPVRSIAFSPDGKTLAAAGRTLADHSPITLWDVDTGRFLRGMGTTDIHSIAFSPDGRFLASAGEEINLWEMQNGASRTLDAGNTECCSTSIAFSADGHTLAWNAKRRGTPIVVLWDETSGQVVTRFLFRDEIASVAFSPSGRTLAVSHGSAIDLWDVGKGQILRILVGHSMIVHSIAFSPNGHVLASASEDHTIKLWGLAPNL